MGIANQTLAWLALSAVAAGSPLAAAAAQKPAAPAAQKAANGPQAQGNQDAQDTEGGAPAAKKKDPAVAERAYAAGVKAFEAGKMAEAIQSLSAALANGGLPAPQMAKALYYRGAAYRKQEKPAQAISDLTTAVWLKGGLSDADKAQAIEQRQQAYREAGLGETAPPIGATPLDAPASPAAKPAANTTVATAPQSSFWGNLFPWGSSSEQSTPPAPAAAPSVAPQVAPAPAAETPAWQTTAPQQQAVAEQPAVAPAPPVPVASYTEPLSAQVSSSFATTGTPPATPVAPAPGLTQTASVDPPSAAPSAVPEASAPAAQSSNPFSGVDKAVTGFFDNMFSSGPSATPPASPSSPVATSATATPPTTATSSSPPQWHDATIVASAEPAKGPATDAPLPWATQSAAAPQPAPVAPPPVIVAKTPKAPPVAPSPVAVAPPPVAVEPPPVVAAAPEAPPPAPAPPVPVTASAPAGKYRLQVAAVRSRDEAERLASSVMKHQGVGAAVQPEIEEAVLGSMGTFYRVRLGPYADATEPGQLCKSLRPQGFDCLVVTQ